MNGWYKIIALLGFILIISSCVSYPAMVNFNEPPGIPDQPQAINNFQAVKIQPSDILSIQVTSQDASAIQPFLSTTSGDSESGSSGGGSSGYLVNSGGEINFPTLGKIYLKDLNTEEAAEKVLQLLDPYFERAPIVNVRLMNFTININGEVNNPGIFPVRNDRVTIMDALSMAGDFTNFSRRDSILIIREKDGERTFGYIDLNSSNAFNSPYFYLQQNDVVYVKPAKTKTNSIQDPASRLLPWIYALTSLTALFVTIANIR